MEEWSMMPFIYCGGVDRAKMYTHGLYQACPGPVTFLLSKYGTWLWDAKLQTFSLYQKSLPLLFIPHAVNVCAQLVFLVPRASFLVHCSHTEE